MGVGTTPKPFSVRSNQRAEDWAKSVWRNGEGAAEEDGDEI